MNYRNLSHDKMLKEIRHSLNITQKKLAERLKISRGYVSELENNVKKPSLKLSLRIRGLYYLHCVINKPKPLVEVMTPENPKKNWLIRLINWFFGVK